MIGEIVNNFLDDVNCSLFVNTELIEIILRAHLTALFTVC